MRPLLRHVNGVRHQLYQLLPIGLKQRMRSYSRQHLKSHIACNHYCLLYAIASVAAFERGRNFVLPLARTNLHKKSFIVRRLLSIHRTINMHDELYYDIVYVCCRCELAYYNVIVCDVSLDNKVYLLNSYMQQLLEVGLHRQQCNSIQISINKCKNINFRYQ